MSRRRHDDSQSPQGSGEPSGEGQDNEFTRVVRRKLASSTRTGQACDRCKVRKIRCDGLPGGCSPCIQNRNECRTTDRISQKAVPRGHLENLERKVAELEAKNRELQASLAIQMQQAHNYTLQDWTENGASSQRQDPLGDRWRTNGRSGYSHSSLGSNSTLGSRPRPVSFVNSNTRYLGMLAGNSYLTTMKQHALSLFGIDIDLDALDPADNLEASDSTTGALRSMFNITSQTKVELPPRQETFDILDYYFLVSHPYLPILHRPSFMDKVRRVFDDSTYQASIGTLVCMHMVLAIMQWQKAADDRLKNRGELTTNAHDLFRKSKDHYHYCLSHMYELNSSASLEDLQALALIVQHLRSFPKPGRSWLMARYVMSLCIELGLHRSISKWNPGGEKPNAIELEMRKRVFWCVMTIESSLAAKLGRPISLREGDYDVEYPERAEDDDITETGIQKTIAPEEECSLDIALELFKFSKIAISIHSTLYGAVRPSVDRYVPFVEDLEQQLRQWKDNLPPTLSLESRNPVKQFQAAHAHFWFYESRILLRHPSLNLSPNPEFTNACTRICVESSREIMRLTDQLRKGSHYLDTTWYGASVQLVATLTILFSTWEQRDTIKPEEIEMVKKDMEQCKVIMGDLGSILGAPEQLQNIIDILTRGTLKLLNPRAESKSHLHSIQPDPGRLGTTTSGPPSGYPTATAHSAPSPLPTLVNPSSDAQQNSSYSDGNSSGTANISFIDPLVAAADTSTSFSNASNSNFPHFSSGQANGYSTQVDNTQQSHTGQHVAFPWPWPNSSWNKFSQDLSYVATEPSPPILSQEVYDGITGLAALQAQNLSSTPAAVAAAALASGGLSLTVPSQNGSAAGGGHHVASPGANGYGNGGQPSHNQSQWNGALEAAAAAARDYSYGVTGNGMVGRGDQGP